MSIIEISYYQGFEGYEKDDLISNSHYLQQKDDVFSNTHYLEHKIVFEVNDFILNIDTYYGMIVCDEKIGKIINKYIPGLLEHYENSKEYGECLVQTAKDTDGDPYVRWFLKTIKINGVEIFNIDNYNLEVTVDEDGKTRECYMSEKNPTDITVLIKEGYYQF